MSEPKNEFLTGIFIVGPIIVFLLVIALGLLIGLSFGLSLVAAFIAQIAFARITISVIMARSASGEQRITVLYTVGVSATLNCEIEEFIGLREYVLEACDSFSLLEKNLARHGGERTIAIIDVDDCPCLEMIIENLTLLRARCPKMGVILISHQFSQDNFSHERYALCNASLRKPVAPEQVVATVAYMTER